MSSDVETRSFRVRNAPLYWGSWALGIGLVLALLYWFLVGNSAVPITATKGQGDDTRLEGIRDDLLKETDVTTCKNALQTFNNHINEVAQQRPPAMDPALRARLQLALHLNEDEQSEIDSGTYTTLDAHHLDLCFLLRDVAQSIQGDMPIAAGDDQSPRVSPLEQATAAFLWVMREVRLDEAPSPMVPSQFVLRRGSGTYIERAMVFLDLLRQFNVEEEHGSPLTPCLLQLPGGAGEEARLWTAGVVIDGKIYLFDPRLGLPIPGPDGKGVATLAEALTDPRVLGQLNVNDKYPYDMTRDKAQKCEAFVYVPLSALSPRMGHFQKTVLAPAIRVNLTADYFAEEAVVQTALKTAGAASTQVLAWPDGLRLLRAFLPVDEGGVDKIQGFPLNGLPGFATVDDRGAVQMWRQRYFEMQQVPWREMDDVFRRFPYNVGLGSFVRERFRQPFFHSALEPKGARDLILRGRYTQAIPDLMHERDQRADDMRQFSKAFQSSDFADQVRNWVEREAIPAYANLERAKQNGDPATIDAALQTVSKIWESPGARTVILLLRDSIARPRAAQVTYLLALCKHELAEQLQGSLDAASRRQGVPPSKVDAERARIAWKSADEWWRHAAEEYAKGRVNVAIRRPHGRCQAMLGDWRAAIATWEDTSGDMPALERVGNLYLAQQLRKQHPTDGKP